jgi:medium-chain acyl-[acyl-carrier-protein] hydrolase
LSGLLLHDDNEPKLISSFSDSTKWFVRPHVKSGASRRLFFFPYAGGGPAAFSAWCGALPKSIEGWIAHYPGRGSRFNEPLINEIPQLVERLARAIEPFLEKPFSFFGHSLGGLIAFELARDLRRRNHPPDSLFISACAAPHLPRVHPRIHRLPDAEFIAELKDMSGIPSELTQSGEAMSLLLPVLRADFQAFENYVHVPDEPLSCPITVFGGSNDPRANRKEIEAWSFHTTAAFTSFLFSGDHFFLHNAKDPMLAVLSGKEIIHS